MRQYFVPLSFGLLGGLVTFLGGLTGEIEFSVLIPRSLIAVVLSSIICFAILFYISKSLFPEYDFFGGVGGHNYQASQKAKKTKPSAGTSPPQSSANTEEASLIAASEKYPGQNIEDSVEALEKRLNSETNSNEEQLRNADSRELANIVRHSMNEE